MNGITWFHGGKQFYVDPASKFISLAARSEIKELNFCSLILHYLKSCSSKLAALLRSGSDFVKPSRPFKKYVNKLPFPWNKKGETLEKRRLILPNEEAGV